MQQGTVRGQSPETSWQPSAAQASEIQQTAGMQGEMRGALENQLYDDTVSHHRYRMPADAGYAPGMYAGYGQSPYAGYGNFDQQPSPVGPYAGFSKCPPQYQEQCWDHGGRRHRGIYHYHTYSYREPDNLSYPCPNQPGGVVTYPYYTHKGPSDFFYKGDQNTF